jgi:two-component system phosphate regulon sensor histidine kinase PhoR
LQGDITFLSNPEKFLQANGTVLKDAKGKEIGAVIVLNDVTRLKKLEKIRRDFVANVSHELKTPVTSIKGFLETLREGAIDDPENAHRFLEIISKNADRLSSIIEDLLILSRLDKEDDGGEVVTETYSINELVDSTMKDCVKKALSKDIELVSDLPDEIQARINPTLLRQALVNLVDNAIKYSEPGKKVLIRALSDSNCIALSVTDEGCGISKEHHSRIFERFYRVDKGRSRREGGTGLGLSIVKHIVNAHGGRISLESSPGKGSTFNLYIPVDLTQGVPCNAGTFTKRH